VSVGATNWQTQFLTILFEIPADFEYIDLRFGPNVLRNVVMQAFGGIFWHLEASTGPLCEDAP
jgi:hypothetical protein